MKIGIIGAGQVGAASGYACVLRGVGSQLVLVDKNADLARAQAEDILHATPFAAPIPVSGGGDYATLEGAGIVMIAAGVAQQPGESRLDLLKRNAEVFEDIVPRILDAAPEAVLLIASNPVDVMTHMVTHIAVRSHGIMPARIIGSGTILDTARFRALLAAHLGVSSHSVHAYVLGEHGDSEVLHWSGVSVGNMPLADCAAQLAAPVTEDIRVQIDDGVRRAAARIIAGKGATWFGIGAGMARLAQAITDDEHAIITCSMLTPDVGGVKNVTLSLPRTVSRAGIGHTLLPPLAAAEKQSLTESAHVLRAAAGSIGL
ncbi:MAG: L-lactate dehydrogenase [Alphaproteobacteria bacterium]